MSRQEARVWGCLRLVRGARVRPLRGRHFRHHSCVWRVPTANGGRLADPGCRNMECLVYQKPAVQKFGSFRELTQVGTDASSDGAAAWGIGNSPGSGCWFDSQGMLQCPTAS